jgi:hypothetical protein
LYFALVVKGRPPIDPATLMEDMGEDFTVFIDMFHVQRKREQF